MTQVYNPEDVKIYIGGKQVNGFPKSSCTYTRITSTQDMPDNNIVYQKDCGWWYDWDLSGKSEDELETLFQENIIYKREEK